MIISDISLKDSVIATVLGTAKDGVYLSIDNLQDETPIVKLYDYFGKKGDKVLVTIAKISEDKMYIKTRLDSFIASGDDRLVA